MLSLLLLVTALAAPDAAAGYLAPGAAEAGGVRHLCLIYHGQARRPAWTRDSLRPYVARVDAEGRPQEWLFDSFLFIEFATDEGRQLYYHAADKTQPDVQDWVWLADAWFRPDSGLIGLEQCVAETGAALGDPEHRVNVVITLPVPLREMTGFGPLPGTETPLDFSRDADRETAMRWYMDTVRGVSGRADTSTSTCWAFTGRGRASPARTTKWFAGQRNAATGRACGCTGSPISPVRARGTGGNWALTP